MLPSDDSPFSPGIDPFATPPVGDPIATPISLTPSSQDVPPTSGSGRASAFYTVGLTIGLSTIPPSPQTVQINVFQTLVSGDGCGVQEAPMALGTDYSLSPEPLVVDGTQFGVSTITIFSVPYPSPGLPITVLFTAGVSGSGVSLSRSVTLQPAA